MKSIKRTFLTLTLISMALTITGLTQERQKETVIAAPASPFTYQGKLTVGGTAANGSYDLIVQLYSEPERGDLLGEQTVEGVQVVNGIFTVNLEFETGLFQRYETAFLDIQVSPAGQGEYAQLTPRQQIGSTPYSKIAETSREADFLTCTNCITNGHIASGISGSKISGPVATATNADNATNAVNAQTAQNAVNAVDLTSNQTVGGNKTFTGLLTGNGSGLTNVAGTLKWNVVTGTSVTASPNNAYVATNTGQTVITLPASANPGDVIKIRAQGDGGFRISQLAGQQILESNIPGNSFSSTPTENFRNWNSITSSADGAKLAATVTNGQIYTSTDSGLTWTPRDSNRNWFSITSSADGTKLAAVTNGGHIYTSADSGSTWTARLTDTDRFWRGIASSADGTKLAAVASGDRIYTSTDSGVTWTARENNRGWSSITSSADGTKLAAVGDGNVRTSSDSGVTWNATTTNNFINVRSITSSADGTRLALAIFGGQIFTSSDSGASWTATESSRSWQSITSSADGTNLAAVVDGGQIYISKDSGETWSVREIPRAWRTIVSTADGTKLATVVNGGRIYIIKMGANGVPATTIGTTGYLRGEKFSTIELVYIGSGQFVAVNATGNFEAF